MKAHTLESFVEALIPGRALLGLDLGTKTIGLALSDVTWTAATPLKTQKRTKFTKDAEVLLETITQHNVGGLVLGLPLNMDASEGPRAQATRAFARNLCAMNDLPVVFWDERLSTVEAERTLVKADLSRQRRAEVIDSVAASFILQGLLDRISYLRRQP